MFKSLLDKIDRIKTNYKLRKDLIRTYSEIIEKYEHIWDGLCDNMGNCDISILYDKEKRKYILEIETIYPFDNKEAERKYIHDLFKELTNWMETEGYSKDGEISLLAAFDMKEKEFDTIEELYAYFKMLVEEKV